VVLQALRYLTALGDHVLSPGELGITQFQCLISWLRMIHCHPQTGQKNDEDQTTLSSNLKLLERDGLIGIVPREDRRAKLVAISKAGGPCAVALRKRLVALEA
jgi:DNA-binding MarR family transcriptional regulator